MTDSRRDRDRDPRPLGEALAAVARDLGIGDPVRSRAVLDGWAEVVGPALAGHSAARTLREGRLTVVVDSPVWATQIVALESQILSRIADVIGEGACTALHVRVDPGAARRR